MDVLCNLRSNFAKACGRFGGEQLRATTKSRSTRVLDDVQASILNSSSECYSHSRTCFQVQLHKTHQTATHGFAEGDPLALRKRQRARVVQPPIRPSVYPAQNSTLHLKKENVFAS